MSTKELGLTSNNSGSKVRNTNNMLTEGIWISPNIKEEHVDVQDPNTRGRSGSTQPPFRPPLSASQGVEAPAPHDEILALQPVARRFHEDPPHGHRHAEDTAWLIQQRDQPTTGAEGPIFRKLWQFDTITIEYGPVEIDRNSEFSHEPR